MNPPKVIYVGDADYEVKFRKSLSTPDLVGETDFAETTVYLRKTQSPSALRDTVLHEVVHAIVWNSGVRANLELDHSTEEKLVVTITPWILSLLRDNPKLVDFLMENRDREF